MGSLGFKDEAAGKVRVFAMVDPYTQWLLKPLWDHISSVLRIFPTDGTYDQHAPMHRLNRNYRNSPKYSFDLTAATDRLPITLQVQLLTPFLGRGMVELWRTLLVGREY